MKNYCTYIVLFGCIILSGSLTGKPENNAKSLLNSTLKVGVYQNTLTGYAEYFVGNTCDNLTNNIVPQNLNRNMIDLTILCLILANEDHKFNIEIVPYPNLSKGITMAEQGLVDTLQVAIWQQDINQTKLAWSNPIIRKGEYEKGIYVHEDSPLLTIPSEQINLKNYIGITMKSWRYDWQIMQQLTTVPADINYILSIYKMLKNGRADFTFLEFSSLSEFAPLRIDDIILKPLSNMKIIIPDSRHFIVSKKYKHSTTFINMLNKGVDSLRSAKRITALYEKAGIFNQKTKNWQIINEW